MKNELVLSPLGHTWVLDLDGTIVKHNGYKTGGQDVLIPGVIDFFESIPEKDFIIFITSRDISIKKLTEDFLKENGIRFNQIIYNAPYGERILLNDMKPSGLKTAYSINTERDKWCELEITEDESL